MLLLLGSRIVAFDVLDFLARSGTILLEILICTLDYHGREALMFGVFELLQETRDLLSLHFLQMQGMGHGKKKTFFPHW